MSFLRRSIDVVNKEVQFEIAENANSVNLRFNPEFEASIPSVLVRVEKVTKNATDKTLYSGRLSDIASILKVAFPVMGSVLPFAIGKSLVLNDDDKLVITLSFDGEEMPTSFEYEINKFADTTSNPLVIKKVVVDEEASFSTEFYPLLLLPKTVESYETIVLKEEQTSTGIVTVPYKIFIGKALLSAQAVEGHAYVPMVTAPNQQVTIKGLVTVYLILLN